MSAVFQLDGRSVTADDGETILDVARREGIEIPFPHVKLVYRPPAGESACPK